MCRAIKVSVRVKVNACFNDSFKHASNDEQAQTYRKFQIS